jgi:hypothetical protein
MHVARELYPIERALAERRPCLRPPQPRGLALWVLGAVLAHSVRQLAVLAALLAHPARAAGAPLSAAPSRRARRSA